MGAQSQSAGPRGDTLFHQREGRFTRERRLSPGGFGLGQVPADRTPDATTNSICGFCSTGCGLKIHLKDGQAVALTPTTDYPVNRGSACPKGWEALTVLRSDDRATTPLLRGASGKLEAVNWDTAMRAFAGRFQSIQQRYGPHSVAFLSTGQITTEEMALLGSVAKFGMGLLHGDGNTRQCMATSVVAYKEAFGFDAPPYTYKDFEESDVIVLVGSNLAIAHPILYERIRRNPHHPRLLVIDPRTTETARVANVHLALAPASDLALFYGLAHILLREGWVDRDFIAAHTNDFEAFEAHVQRFTPADVAATTGLEEAQLFETARTIHDGERVSFWWTMGVNQSHQGVRTAQSIINLALMTGNIGREGTGANSITGQCNAMGSRLFSNTTNLLGGHDFADPRHRDKVADCLGIDAARIPDRPGWAYHEIVNGIATDRIKGLWVIATNPAHSWINRRNLDGILDKLDFLVVQDMYHTTETARRADLVLPAAAWGEKEGTFINSERRIGRVRKVVHPPGEALPDFAIFRLVAKYWGCGEMFEHWSSPQAVFEILKRLSEGQPCDITGIEDYAALDDRGGIQWPCRRPEDAHVRERRLFADGRFYHADGRARFLFEDPTPMSETPDDRYPLILLTGRGTAAQWHTQTRTSQSAVLRKLYPAKAYIEINPIDAQKHGVVSGQAIFVESRRGRVGARAFVTPTVRPGQVFMPMHYAVTNELTDSVFDPYSKQPAYKACAVSIRPRAYWEEKS